MALFFNVIRGKPGADPATTVFLFVALPALAVIFGIGAWLQLRRRIELGPTSGQTLGLGLHAWLNPNCIERLDKATWKESRFYES